MSVFKSVKYALLFSAAAFVLSANTASAVNVDAKTADPEALNAVSDVISSSTIKDIMNSVRDGVLAQKVQEKPIINNVMPKIETVMLPVIKEKILPEKMAGLQKKISQQIAPQF